MLTGRIHDSHTVHQVSAQHLVLDLDLVERQEEGSVASKQPGAHQVRMRVQEASCSKRLTTLFLGQRRVLLETCGHGSTKIDLRLVLHAASRRPCQDLSPHTLAC